MKSSTRPSGVSAGFNQFKAQDSKREIAKENKTSEFTVKLASTLEEREAAYRLAYQVYLNKGYVKQNVEEWLISKYDANPDTAILIVLDKNKKVIGSVTLIFDSQDSLPAATIFSEEIKSLRLKQEKIVEISRLVIDPDFRNAKEILILLFNYLYIYSYYVKNYTCLTIEVNPRHKDYYRSLLMFDVIASEKPCPTVQNAPAVLLYVSLAQGEIEISKCMEQTSESKNRSLYPYFLKSECEGLVISYLKKQFRPMSSDEKVYFGFSDTTLQEVVFA